MICNLHPNYIPHNEDPVSGVCVFCWEARCHWLHENRKLHIGIAQDLRERAGHFTPDARVEHLEVQVQKLTKRLARFRTKIKEWEQVEIERNKNSM